MLPSISIKTLAVVALGTAGIWGSSGDAAANESLTAVPERPRVTASSSSDHVGGLPIRLAQYEADGYDDSYRSDDRYRPLDGSRRDDGAYSGDGYGSGSAYNSGPPVRDRRDNGGEAYGNGDNYQSPNGYDRNGEPYQSNGAARPRGEDYGGYDGAPDDSYARRDDGTYSKNEILNAGHQFFGSLSQGLASVIEYAFQKSGRPNGYILGEDAGGAFVAGLRYGEGRLYTRDAGTHKVFWQGPSIGYDFGAEGSKTMILVYNMRSPSEIYHRFGGVQGSAYLVGGFGIQFQKYGDVVMAPIRAGVGVRLGANVGYLKYTRSPTWNPF